MDTLRLIVHGPNRTEVRAAGCEVLFSYQTPVAARIDGRGYVRTEVNHSRTTNKHIGQWIPGDAERVPQEFLDTLLVTRIRSV